MKMSRLFAAMAATAVSVSAFSAMTFSSADAAGTEIGEAYIIGAVGGTQRWDADAQKSAGSTVASVDGDAQYEVTWKVEDGGGTDTVQFLAVCIAPTGDTDNFTTDTLTDLAVTLDEVWIDGTQISGYSVSSNAVNTAYYEGTAPGVTRIYLHDDWAGTKVADLPSATDIASEVKVRFTVKGTGTEGTSNVKSETETTTSGTTSESTTSGTTSSDSSSSSSSSSSSDSSAATTTASSSSDSKTTTTAAKSDSKTTTTAASNGGANTTSSNTGDAGVGAAVSVLTLAAASAFIAKKKD